MIEPKKSLSDIFSYSHLALGSLYLLSLIINKRNPEIAILITIVAITMEIVFKFNKVLELSYPIETREGNCYEIILSSVFVSKFIPGNSLINYSPPFICERIPSRTSNIKIGIMILMKDKKMGGMLYENIAPWKINYMCLIIMSIYFKDPLPDAMKLKVKLPINI